MTAYPTPDLGIYGRCSTSAGSNPDAHARSISATLQNWFFYQARVANNAIINIVIQSWTTVRICQIAITPGRAVAGTHTHVIPRKSEGYKTAVHPQNRRLKGGRRSHAAIKVQYTLGQVEITRCWPHQEAMKRYGNNNSFAMERRRTVASLSEGCKN
jgi:hypothetical protein